MRYMIIVHFMLILGPVGAYTASRATIVRLDAELYLNVQLAGSVLLCEALGRPPVRFYIHQIDVPYGH